MMLDSLMRAQALGCMDAMALKLSKFGGVSACLRARELCIHFGAKMCIECTWGSDIVTAASVHLAASTPAPFVLNVADLSRYVTPRLAGNGPVQADGFVPIPEGAGLGVTPDPDILGEPTAVFT